MECSIGSIADLCLGTPTDTLAEGFTSTSAIVELQGEFTEVIQCWMRENLSSRDIESGTFHSLAAVVMEASRIQCTLPENDVVEGIVCDWVFK